jgi:hypothetical protein
LRMALGECPSSAAIWRTVSPSRFNAAVPAEGGVAAHPVTDNDATDKAATVKRCCLTTRGSWPTTRPRARRGRTRRGGSSRPSPGGGFDGRVFQGVTPREAAIASYLAAHDANPKPFARTATAGLILRRVEDVCKRTHNSGHSVNAYRASPASAGACTGRPAAPRRPRPRSPSGPCPASLRGSGRRATPPASLLSFSPAAAPVSR